MPRSGTQSQPRFAENRRNPKKTHPTPPQRGDHAKSGAPPTPLSLGGRLRTPLNGRVSARKESAVKPGSVVDSHSSGMRVTAQLKQPTRKPHVGHMVRSKAPRASLFGLAPGGVCRAADVATSAVRSYRTISPLPAPLARHLGGIFLLHFPWARAPQALPGTVPYGARTFLHVLAHTATVWPTLGAHPISADAPCQRGLKKAPRDNGVCGSAWIGLIAAFSGWH
jgi:hypothetical protein